MSGSGGGGGGGGGGPIDTGAPCDKLIFDTTLATPNPAVVPGLAVGQTLPVVLQQEPARCRCDASLFWGDGRLRGRSGLLSYCGASRRGIRLPQRCFRCREVMCKFE